ncbi:MAG: chromate transporter [Blastocatellia bacterium]|nr:chromate transporter [Blastocatellia bacterium]
MTLRPVLITATFVGYYVAGFLGAIISTIAVFLPSLLITIIIGHPLERFRTNPQVQAFLSSCYSYCCRNDRALLLILPKQALLLK